MKITFLGATEEVTGSKYLIEADDIKILVDCGLFQGEKEITKRNWEPFPLDPRAIDALVLTHAHVDHTGYIPLLVKNGFKGKIYCSRGTYELCTIVLVDSGTVMEEEAKNINDKGLAQAAPVVPLYTAEDAKYSLNFFEPIDYDTVVRLGKSLQATLISSGHIIGASFVIITDGKQKLTFSGDLGNPEQLIMKAPPHLKETDFLVLESTYGNRLHEEGDPIAALGNIINETVKKRGVLLLPCFAVGRAQTILYCLYQLQQKNIIPNLPIFLDSPMAISTTELFCKYQDEHTLGYLCKEVVNVASGTPTVEESKKIDSIAPPAIIIAGSGMVDGGRMIHHLKHFIADPKNTIVFVGFQAQGTHGRELIDGAKEIKIHGTWYPVHIQIKSINTLSAHADYEEILEWLSYFEKKPKKVFITHGELEAAQALKQKIEERFGWPVVIPKYLESFDLD